MAWDVDRYSLVADIGGTNTRVALAEGRQVLADTVKRYRNKDYPGLESVIRAYVTDIGGVDCIAACVAVAGPVRDGVGTMTNLDWAIDRQTLAHATGAETADVINDLQAQGHGLGYLADGSLRPVIAGHTAEGATQLVIGVGTGFNAAPVYETASGRIVTPAEAGHVSLPIRTETDLRLCNFVETVHGFPSVEDVLSGRGLERIYIWLGREAEDPREASAQEIMEGLASGKDPRAAEAAAVFIRLLGTVAGDLSLITLPFGGVYLIGGVVRAMQPYFDRFDFAGAFRDKGRFAGFMGNFPVSVVEDDYAALTGCASYLAGLR